MMIDWKAKLCSRKLWMAIAGLVSGILLAFKVGENDVSAIGGIILSTGSVIAYILGEGWADAAGAANAVFLTDEEPEAGKDPEEDPLRIPPKDTRS